MSLNLRLQTIAREETANQVAGVQEQITDLHEHLHEAITRIAHLEAAAKGSGAEAAAAHPHPTEESPRPAARRTTAKRATG